MGVGIGERRQQHTAPAVGDRHTRCRLASGDLAIVDQDVDRATARLARPRPNVPQQQISHVSNRSVQNRVAQGFGLSARSTALTERLARLGDASHLTVDVPADV